MNYIAKAFIEIKNKKQRDFVKEELNKIFRRSNNSKFERSPFFLFANGAYEQNNKYCMFLSSKRDAGFIDCNHYANRDEELAIKLFLVLAKMRDDSGSDTRWLICDNPHFDDMYNITFERNEVIDGWQYEHIDTGLFSIATPLELAEAVQRGDIKLDNHE